jgi:hypothetical protein
MKRFATMLLVTILALPALASEKLLGRWELTTRSKGGVGQTFEFRPDGELVVMPGAMVDAKFVRDGSKITTTMPDGSAALFEVEVTGDQLARKANNAAVKMTRVGKVAEGSDLVGVWTYEYNLGGPAYEIFTSEGMYHFRYPFSKGIQKGRYEMKGDFLQLTMADGRKLSVKPSFADEKTLVLTDELGKGEKYVRAPY